MKLSDYVKVTMSIECHFCGNRENRLAYDEKYFHALGWRVVTSRKFQAAACPRCARVKDINRGQ